MHWIHWKSLDESLPTWSTPVPSCVRRVHLHWNASMIMADGFTGLLGWSWHSTPISFKAWTNCWTCRYCQSSVKKHGWDGVHRSLFHISPHFMSGCFRLDFRYTGFGSFWFTHFAWKNLTSASLAAACENANDFGRAVGCGSGCDSGCVCGLESGEALPSPISWRNV